MKLISASIALLGLPAALAGKNSYRNQLLKPWLTSKPHSCSTNPQHTNRHHTHMSRYGPPNRTANTYSQSRNSLSRNPLRTQHPNPPRTTPKTLPPTHHQDHRRVLLLLIRPLHPSRRKHNSNSSLHSRPRNPLHRHLPPRHRSRSRPYTPARRRSRSHRRSRCCGAEDWRRSCC